MNTLTARHDDQGWGRNTSPPDGSGPTRTRPLRRRRSIRAVAFSAIAGILGAVAPVGHSGTVDAAILHSSAYLECRPGVVTAHLPARNTTRSTLASSPLEAVGQLWVLNPYTWTWQPATDRTGRPITWRAYGSTVHDGTLGLMYSYSNWVSPMGWPMPWYAITVASGYTYTVKTIIVDQGDGTSLEIWNSGNSGTSCLA